MLRAASPHVPVWTATTSYSGQAFRDFHEAPEVESVIEDARLEDIIQDNRFEKPVEVRIMSPSESFESSFSTISEVEEHYDQDYDEYTLHMSSFESSNTTYESLPGLDRLQHEDVLNVQDVQNYWEAQDEAPFLDELLSFGVIEGAAPPEVEDF